VGLTEAQARKDHQILVGMTPYDAVAMGESLMETDGFAKAIIERESNKILGFHIIGPEASILVQEVIDLMANDLTRRGGAMSIHIHPALPEVVLRALYNVGPVR
jgi:mycothione reductase